MGLKNVMVLLTDAGDPHRLLPLAGQVGNAAGAHLTAVYVTDLGDDDLPTQLEHTRTSVVNTAKELGFACEWREFSDNQRERILHVARSFDYIVASQPDQAGGNKRKRSLPEDVVIASGRPVLLIPRAGEFRKIGTRALVAWDGSREAARALHDSVPLLAKAKEVSVYRVNPRSGDEAMDADIVTQLNRAGIAASHHSTRAGRPPSETAVFGRRDLDFGDVLLSASSDLGADLLVMGAYHHSRARESVFGGVTSYIFEHMTVPVLMSH